MNRRTSIKTLAAAGMGGMFSPLLPAIKFDQMKKRIIPVSGEQLPVVGVGTWQSFDVGGDATRREELKKVLKTLVENGGSVVDSSPMYGTSEQVAGDLSAETGLQEKLFFATKVWTNGREAGIREMEKSMRLMRTPVMDLMQIHNLVDWKTHVKTLRSWKDAGKIRYWGITHYHSGAYDEVERVVRQEKPDFVQINFSLDERESMRRLIPFCAENGAAIIINRPFGGGGLFSKTKGQALPDWAAGMDATSWAQVFLKYILSYEEVTCVIPGTGKSKHMADNVQAGFGRLPDEKLRRKIQAWVEG